MGKTVGSMTFHYLIAWHTPEKYIEAARSMMGTIDLDPTTDELAQKRIAVI